LTVGWCPQILLSGGERGRDSDWRTKAVALQLLDLAEIGENSVASRHEA
jgi:hypothetical protein